MSEHRGPIEDLPWPTTLTARVMDPGPPRRLHGYEVHRDLAKHFGFAEVIFCALTGELPNDKQARVFETSLVLLSPVGIHEAPAHAAMVARLCGSRTSGVIATGAVALAEQARHLVHEHAELLEWLVKPSGALPSRFRTADDAERAEVASALEALGPEVATAVRNAEPTLACLLIAALFECGFDTADKLEAVLCVARLPCVMAEALSATPGDFRGYPMNLPAFEYEEGDPT